MRNLMLLLLITSIFSGATAFANGEYIGPAFRVDEDGWCAIDAGAWLYEGTYFIQYSNGKQGHATFKCKLELTYGDPQLGYSESDTGSFPLGSGAMCWTTESYEGETAMWTSQCFNAWEDGE